MRPDRGAAPSAPRAPFAGSYGACVSAAGAGAGAVSYTHLDTDLAFERSEVEATITTPVVSIKNPLRGSICAPAVGAVIRDIEGADATVCVCGHPCPASCAQQG